MDSWAALIIGVLGAMGGTAGTILGVLASWKKNKLQARQDELDYIFGKYKETVERLQKEQDSDRAHVLSLQADHLHCREEISALKERDISKTAEIEFLRKRILVMEGPVAPKNSNTANP